eukprot:scaffold2035_cov214-Chaetoceros_neogracile.AAC.6
MNKLQLRLLSFFFSAFFPSKESGNEDDKGATFYSALEVSTKATTDDIRKAYKKKSLQHHPDKVAQFARSQDKTPEQIQTDFVRIQEAYETLSDQSKRDAYDVLGEEGGKMVTGGALKLDYHKLIYILAEASIVDKCKLFSMVVLAVSFPLLGPVLICAKVDATLLNTNMLTNETWVAIMAPFWIFHILVVLLALLGQAWFITIQMLCIAAFEILLALKWDGKVDAKYELVLIPLFLYQALRLMDNVATVLKVEKDIARMVTMNYLERHIIPVFFSNDENGDGEVSAQRSYEDLTVEEREEINQAYIIITEEPCDPMEELEDNEEESLNSVQAEIKLTYAIANSPEFQHASTIDSFAKKSSFSCIMFRMPFLILLVLQLDGDRGWDWNIVFAPIWIEVLFQALSSCWTPCCGSNLLGNRGDESDMEIIEIDLDNEDETNVDDIEANKENESLLSIQVNGENTDEITKNSVEVVEKKDMSESIKGNNEGLDISEPAVLEESTTNMPLEPVQTKTLPANDDDASDQYDDFGNTNSASAGKCGAVCGSCCNYMMLVIGLSLLVVKLNRATDMDDSVGYSSYWVLFPLYLYAALLLITFGCCIFAVPANMMEADEDCQEDQDEDVVADGEVNQDVVNKSIVIGEQDEETGDIAFEGPSSDLEFLKDTEGLVPEDGAIEAIRYMGSDVKFREVKDVAPGKVVVCVSFKVTDTLLRILQGDFIDLLKTEQKI